MTARWISLGLLLAVPAFAQAPDEPKLRAFDTGFQAPAVTLLDAGKAPRALLRYRPTTGLRRAITFRTTGEYQVKADGREARHVWPNLEVRLDAVAESAQRDGSANWRFEFAGAQAVDGSGAKALLDPATAQTFQALAGVTARLPLDARGLPGKLDIRPRTDDAHRDKNRTVELRSYYAIEMAKQLLAQLTPPFPAEAVGIGARWKAERPAVRGVISIVQTITYELASVGPNGVELRATFGAAPGTMAGVKEGQLFVDYSGKGTLSLDGFGPGSNRHEDQGQMKARIDDGAKRDEHQGRFTLRIDAVKPVESGSKAGSP